MNKKDFNDVSIRGRVAFAIMCFEEYVSVKYPGKDFTVVCQLMWDIVSDKDCIDISAEKYMEIIPEYLYEFESYEDAGLEFLTPEEFAAMRSLIPAEDSKLNLIMHRIYDIAMEHAYGAIKAPAQASIDLLFDVINVLKGEGFPVPSVNTVAEFTFAESDGWGCCISYEGLSTVLR